LIFLVLCTLFASMASFAVELRSSCSPSREIPGQYLVRIQSSHKGPEASSSEKQIFSRFALVPLSHSVSKPQSGILNLKSLSKPKIETFLAETYSDSALRELLATEGVLSVEKNCWIHSMALPNDPDISKNIGLSFIRASGAWSVISKSDVVVAVSDTGVDISHHDLQDNIWQNTAELNGLPGVDDDQNGFIDDINGWGFPEGSNDPSPGTYEGADHGTHVAGIIGSVGNNNTGSAGVAWSVKLMPLRAFKKSIDDAALSDLISSVYYAVNNGAQIVNCSWGAEGAPTQAEIDVFAYAESKGVLIVAAAGNESKNVSLYSPASISTVLAVGSINSRRELSSFSSYGLKIGVLAPGGDVVTTFGTGIDERIYSTVTGGGYDYKVGTSISAPFVTGVAALVKTLLPQITPKNMIQLLREAGDLASIRTGGVNVNYSILNAEKAVVFAQQVSQVNPNCSDNCIQSGTLDFSSTGAAAITHFGGGGCALFKQDGFKSAGTSPWDLSFIISALIPLLIDHLRKRTRRQKK
jgi:subtilisin family serine protease